MRALKIDCPDVLAEGRCLNIPFELNVVETEGLSIHFWIPADEALDQVIEVAKAHEEFTFVTYSEGQPKGFWAARQLEPAD